MSQKPKRDSKSKNRKPKKSKGKLPAMRETVVLDDLELAAVGFDSEDLFDRAVDLLFENGHQDLETPGSDILIIPKRSLLRVKNMLRKASIKCSTVQIVDASDIPDEEWEEILKEQEGRESFSDMIKKGLE